MPNEAKLASERQGGDDYEHRMAAEIVAMLRNTGVDAERVLAYAHAILNLPVGEVATPAAAHDVTRCGPLAPINASLSGKPSRTRSASSGE
jgi:hypothetical protein